MSAEIKKDKQMKVSIESFWQHLYWHEDFMLGMFDLTETHFESTNKAGEMPLHYLVHAGADSCLKVVLSKGANPNKKDLLGEAPVYTAIMADRIACLKTLLDHKADVNTQNSEPITPLYYAASIGNAQALNLLLQYGADKTVPNKEGKLPLDIAKELGYQDCVKALERQPLAKSSSHLFHRKDSRVSQLVATFEYQEGVSPLT